MVCVNIISTSHFLIIEIHQVTVCFPCVARDSLFSANKSPTVPTYADGALLTKCNFLFDSLPACQRGFFARHGGFIASVYMPRGTDR